MVTYQSKPAWIEPKLDAPLTPCAMNQSQDKNAIVRDLVDQPIRPDQQLTNGFVSKLRNDLASVSEIPEGGAYVFSA